MFHGPAEEALPYFDSIGKFSFNFIICKNYIIWELFTTSSFCSTCTIFNWYISPPVEPILCYCKFLALSLTLFMECNSVKLVSDHFY